MAQNEQDTRSQALRRGDIASIRSKQIAKSLEDSLADAAAVPLLGQRNRKYPLGVGKIEIGLEMMLKS